jgi:hypothetical protein
MKSKLAMAAATIALTGLIPGSSRGAETSDSTNVNEPSAASETQRATEPLNQREMTTQGQDLWQSCQTEVNGAPLWAVQKTGLGPLDPAWRFSCVIPAKRRRPKAMQRQHAHNCSATLWIKTASLNKLSCSSRSS